MFTVNNTSDVFSTFSIITRERLIINDKEKGEDRKKPEKISIVIFPEF